MEFHIGELEENLSLFCFQVFVVVSLLIFPIGICMLLIASVRYAKSGGGRKFFASYRSGYICGAKPPTQEDFVARSAVPICLNLNINAGKETRYGDYVSNRPLCLQAGGLDKPAVWCTEELHTAELELPPLFLWWSPCDKCGTAWRIYDTQDNDESIFKRPTSPQPNRSAIPLEDGWLEWEKENKSWKKALSVSISECYSDGGYSGTEDGTNSTTDYTIPPACYSDDIYTSGIPVAVLALLLLVIGFGCILFICCDECREDCLNGGGGKHISTLCFT